MPRYNVVFRTLIGKSCGAITRTSFESKEAFDAWFSPKLRGWYEVVEEGVTDERGEELCTSPEANRAVMVCGFRQISELTQRIADTCGEIAEDLALPQADPPVS